MDTDEAFSSVGLRPLNGFIKCMTNYEQKTYYAILGKDCKALFTAASL